MCLFSNLTSDSPIGDGSGADLVRNMHRSSERLSRHGSRSSTHSTVSRKSTRGACRSREGSFRDRATRTGTANSGTDSVGQKSTRGENHAITQHTSASNVLCEVTNNNVFSSSGKSGSADTHDHIERVSSGNVKEHPQEKEIIENTSEDPNDHVAYNPVNRTSLGFDVVLDNFRKKEQSVEGCVPPPVEDNIPDSLTPSSSDTHEEPETSLDNTLTNTSIDTLIETSIDTLTKSSIDTLSKTSIDTSAKTFIDDTSTNASPESSFNTDKTSSHTPEEATKTSAQATSYPEVQQSVMSAEGEVIPEPVLLEPPIHVSKPSDLEHCDTKITCVQETHKEQTRNTEQIHVGNSEVIGLDDASQPHSHISTCANLSQTTSSTKYSDHSLSSSPSVHEVADHEQILIETSPINLNVIDASLVNVDPTVIPYLKSTSTEGICLNSNIKEGGIPFIQTSNPSNIVASCVTSDTSDASPINPDPTAASPLNSEPAYTSSLNFEPEAASPLNPDLLSLLSGKAETDIEPTYSPVASDPLFVANPPSLHSP